MIYVDENLPKGGKNVTFKKQYLQSFLLFENHLKNVSFEFSLCLK